jgi:ADP-heptose:LPS heptosyltransferase
MKNPPVLVIQMQRLGDLVLSFPLLGWLKMLYPDTPIWVVAEPVFFKGLMTLSPEVTYFPPEAAPALAKESYTAVINLSHRPEAAKLAGAARTEELYGLYQSNGATRIKGDWHLYRAGLTHNNRHNAFHWADLNALDCIGTSMLQKTAWPPMRYASGSEGRIGLFLGASEQDKHPDAAFWAAFAEKLLAAGFKPVLLGGKAEMPLAARTAAILKAPALNMAGRFSLPEFVEVLRSLRLLVTPDTGPMHVAAWTGTPTLNLSLGPVSAWETAPFPPGHFVLQSTLSCVGCWRCKHPRPYCHDQFSPARIASLVRMILSRTPAALSTLHLPGQRLLQSSRSTAGLFRLVPLDISGKKLQPAYGRDFLRRFWQAYFFHTLADGKSESLHTAFSALATAMPAIAERLPAASLQLSRILSLGLRKGHHALGDSFWLQFPPFLRPLTGYLQQALSNEDYSRPAYAHALKLVETLFAALPR